MRLGGSRAGTDPNDATYRWWETTQAEHDHVEFPLGRRWHIAGTIVGLIVVTIVVIVVSIEPNEDRITFRPLGPPTIETETTGPPTIADVEAEVDRTDATVGRVRVSGDDLVRVDVSGTGLCGPVSGSPGAWIEVVYCGPLTELAIEGHDGDDATTVAVARF